jgi:chain length determinant protein tyrosine kinase EpsG
MTLQQFLDILRARWKLAAVLFALVLGSAVAVSLLLPSRYTATAQVLVDVKSPDPVLGLLLPGQMAPGYMATQVDIVTSQRTALKVVDALKIVENPQAIEQWREATDGVGSIRHHFSDLLLRNLDVKPSRESSVLGISYTGADPQFAALVANAFAQAYVDLSVQLKVEPAKQTRGFFDAQLQALRDQLEAAQGRLSAYQRDKGIVSADERLDVENARLAELSSQLVALQAVAVEAGKRQSVAREAQDRGAASDVPEVLQSPLIQSLKADLARVDARLDQQGAVLGPRHPDILKLREERASLAQRIEREIAAVTGSLGKTYRVQSGREAQLRADLDRQRAKVLQLKQVRDELTVLQRDVESAQKAFDLAAQRLAQSSLESQSSQTNVLLLDEAVPPATPSSPKLRRNVALGVFLGALLAVAGVMGSEWTGRRVRGVQDLAAATGLVPLASLRNANSRGARSRLPELHARLRRASRATSRLAPARNSGYELAEGGFGPTLFGALPSGEERPGPDVPDRTSQTPDSAADSTGASQVPIGQILVQAGLIHPPEVERILEWARQEGMRFGEAAVARNLVTAEQVDRALAYQFDYPVLERGTCAVSEEVVAAYEARNPFVADMRRLRARIRSAQLAASDGSPLKALAVMSAGSGDGKSFVAANLAVTFSQMGQKTLLIDADLRRGRLHHLFGLPNGTGLSSMLNRRIVPGSLQRVTGLRGLTVLTAGPVAPNPSELLSRDVLRQLLAAFTRSFDIVILDTPGIAEEPDAALVAQQAGAALVLARRGHSTYESVYELVHSGGIERIKVLGSVLNAV